MPNYYFLTFELLMHLLLVLCVCHAWRSRTRGARIIRLACGVCYGLLLELITIRQLNEYRYGEFLLMIIDVPLCIGVMWGCVIYAAMEFSEFSSASGLKRAFLAGLLAVLTDLVMDPIAIRLGFWDWQRGLQFEYFGVPLANFWAWFWAVSFFAVSINRSEQERGLVRLTVGGAVAVIGSVLGLVLTNWLITASVVARLQPLVAILLIAIAAGYFLYSGVRFNRAGYRRVTFIVPAAIQVWMLCAGVISGAIFSPPSLVFVCSCLIVITIYLHRNVSCLKESTGDRLESVDSSV